MDITYKPKFSIDLGPETTKKIAEILGVVKVSSKEVKGIVIHAANSMTKEDAKKCKTVIEQIPGRLSVDPKTCKEVNSDLTPNLLKLLATKQGRAAFNHLVKQKQVDVKIAPIYKSNKKIKIAAKKRVKK